jgi:hypothetical protein
MDYEALAKQFGGKSAAPPAGGVDYESLARQFGGKSSAAPSPFSSAVPQLDPQGQIIRQPAPLPSTEPSRGVMDVIAGVPEAALTLGSGAVAGTIAPFIAAGQEILSGEYGRGTRETERRAAELTQKFTYQPVSKTGQQIVGTIGEAVEGLGLEAVPISQGLTAAAMAPSAARQATQIAGREAGLVAEAARSIPSVQRAREARVAESFARAPQIDAANLAQQYGIGLDPATSNPSVRTRARVAAVGETELEQKLATQNAPVWTAESKKALDLPPTVTLNDDTFKALKNAPELTAPYAVVRNTPRFVADPATIAKLDEARSPQLVADIDGKVVAKLNKKLDGIKERIADGVDGKVLLDSIQDFRSQASSIYAKGKPTKPLKTGDRNLVKLYDAAADALEEMIDTSLSGEALANYRAARARYAQISSLEAATNKITGVVDPLKLAKQLEDGRPLSGPIADLGRIASTFPGIAKVDAAARTTIPRFARASVGGTVGGLVGGLVGGPMGVPAGIAVGAGVSEIARRVALNQMGTPGYQRSRAMPPDFRPQQPTNALRPVEPGQSNIVPFDPRNAPDFVLSGNERTRVPIDPNRPDLSQPPMPGQQPAPANALRLGQSAPEDVIAGLRAEDARAARMAQMAETQGLAAESVGRAPTAGGMTLDLDPITGRLRPAEVGGEGLPVSPGATLSSAADKLSRGQRFAMSADEMIAWNKTSVELAELMPSMKTLSQKAIAEKMMDRQWVASAIKKAAEKEEAFKLIERQSKDMQMVQQARIARESLMDAVETLQEALSQPRAKERARAKSQGPKTLAAKNQLGQIETLNKLID